MSHRKRTHQNPEPRLEAQPATSQTPPEPQPEQPEVSISEGLQAIIDGLDENHPAREKVIAELEKLKAEQRKSEEARVRLAFDEDLKSGIARLLEGDDGLLAKHRVDLSTRKVIITFPPDNGSFAYSDVDLKASATRKRNGNGKAFKSSWGKAIYQNGEDKTEYDSPSKLATALGLRVTGHSDRVAMNIIATLSAFGNKIDTKGNRNNDYSTAQAERQLSQLREKAGSPPS